jgi:hypothetical protein
VKLFLALLLLLSSDDFSSIQRKMDDIVKEHTRPGDRIHMSLREMNAYLYAQAQAIAPKAVHNTKVELAEGGGTASANINFLELNKARGGQANWLMEKMLDGERFVKVSVHVLSDHGKARVNVDRVEVGGAAISGAPLDYLIQNYVVPQFPNAKVDQWFTMEHHMDHFEIHQSGATVVIGK